MASDKAKIAKDEGNVAFKSGDYPAAIGHYTSAILADGNDLTFPLNRAAAYLKLGKHEDAERDCTTVLKSSPNNVKALFRRGQARTSLGSLDGARADFTRASELEPSNRSVIQELAEVEKLIWRQRQRRSSAACTPILTSHDPQDTSRSATTPTPATSRRRIPIKIIEGNSGDLRHDDATIATRDDEKPLKHVKDNVFLRPLSSRTITPSLQSDEPSPSVIPAQSAIATLPRQTAATEIQTFKNAKQSRDAAKPSGVSGGIFRPSGNHTLFSKAEEIHHPTTTTTFPPVKVDSPVPQSPMTLFNFTKMWELQMKDEDRWNILSGIPPSSLPRMFQASLEPALLSSILQHFGRIIDQQIAAPSDVHEYLVSLSRVQRFGTIMLFMSKDEKILLNRLWEKCGKVDS